MEAFWTNAESIFETARRASDSPDCDWAFLISPQGQIQMLDGAGWTVPNLLVHHGAQTVYRITRQAGRVCLEGRQGSETCLLRSESPAMAAHQLFGGCFPPVVCPTSGPRQIAAATPAKDLWKMFA